MLCSPSDLRWSATIRVRAIRSICVPIRCFFIRSRKSEQARADSLAKVKAKAADSLAGSKGDRLWIHWLETECCGSKASQDGSQADAAAPQAAAGAVETCQTADAGSGSLQNHSGCSG